MPQIVSITAELTPKGRSKLDSLKDKLDRSDVQLAEFLRDDFGTMYTLSHVDETGYLPAEVPEAVIMEVVNDRLVEIGHEEISASQVRGLELE